MAKGTTVESGHNETHQASFFKTSYLTKQLGGFDPHNRKLARLENSKSETGCLAGQN